MTRAPCSPTILPNPPAAPKCGTMAPATFPETPSSATTATLTGSPGENARQCTTPTMVRTVRTTAPTTRAARALTTMTWPARTTTQLTRPARSSPTMTRAAPNFPIALESLVPATSPVRQHLPTNPSSPTTSPLRTSVPMRPPMRLAPARLVRRPLGPPWPPGLSGAHDAANLRGAPAASSASALAPDLPSLLAGLLALTPSQSPHRTCGASSRPSSNACSRRGPPSPVLRLCTQRPPPCSAPARLAQQPGAQLPLPPRLPPRGQPLGPLPLVRVLL
mmetsp:Transcript_33705/g.76227  ORF Transcript_33705/g.76227 Transcript_33705/m.76227 type:complete len:277 (-) Transcript_33705:173-1003(-)